jgi:hypothetical protein
MMQPAGQIRLAALNAAVALPNDGRATLRYGDREPFLKSPGNNLYEKKPAALQKTSPRPALLCNGWHCGHPLGFASWSGMTFLYRHPAPATCSSMIFSENRYPPRIKCGAGIFGIML